MERKFTRVYEDDDAIETWTFDLDKDPVNTKIKYKAGVEKQIKQRTKDNI